MDRPKTMRRIGFQAKVLIPVIFVMVVLIAITMWVVNARITYQLQENVARRLRASDAVFGYAMQIRAHTLAQRCGNIRNEPRFTAVAQLGEAKTLSFLLNELLDELGVDVALFTGPEGNVLAGTVKPPLRDLAPFESAMAESVKQARLRGDAADVIAVDGRMYEAVSLHITIGARSVGVLSVGQGIGDAAMRELSQLTDSDVVLVAGGHVAASTFRERSLAERAAAVLADPQADGSEGRGVRNLVLGGRHYRYIVGTVPSSSGADLAYLLLLSYEQSLQALSETRRLLIVLGVLGILAGSAVLLFIVRTITRPLVQLRDSAEAIGRGDFSRRVEVTTRDECGDLAEGFNRMTENLRNSRAKLEQSMTDLKAAQSQLVQSEKLSGIGEFVAGVTHELNNPLTSVIGFAELLKQSNLDADHMKDVREIYDAAQRCRKIVQSLLTFARQHEPEQKLVDLSAVTEASIDIFRYELRTSNISVHTDYAPGLPGVMADPHQLQQVILNIVNNARQAIEGWRTSGSLRVRTEAAGDRVRLTIKDDGPGIAPENVAKIFDPFFTTKEAGRGTGLGLSISYGIIRKHGGTIEVQSKPGEGALFVIELPAAGKLPEQPQREAPAEGIQPVAAAAARRVLVVDDEDSIVILVRRVLKTFGCDVDAASEGRAALDKIHGTEYDLILCDWKMPGFSGKQVIDELLVRNPDAVRRLVFMTGDVMGEARDLIEETGALFLAKPFTAADIKGIMTRVFGENAGRAAPSASPTPS